MSILIFPGHSPARQGFVGPNSTEFAEATLLAGMLCTNRKYQFGGFLCDREKKDLYATSTASLAIELHYNKSDAGQGPKVYYQPHNGISKSLAEALQGALNEASRSDNEPEIGWYRDDEKNGLHFFLDQEKPALVVMPEYWHNTQVIRGMSLIYARCIEQSI